MVQMKGRSPTATTAKEERKTSFIITSHHAYVTDVRTVEAQSCSGEHRSRQQVSSKATRELGSRMSDGERLIDGFYRTSDAHSASSTSLSSDIYVLENIDNPRPYYIGYLPSPTP